MQHVYGNQTHIFGIYEEISNKMCKKVRFRMVLVLVVVLKKKTDKSITLISHTDHTTNKLLVFHIIYNILYGFNKVKIEFYN